MEYKSIGKLIQACRKEKGLTQKQLADMLNITDKAVSKWERDLACPDTTTIPKLAEILGVTVESLLNAKTITTSSETEFKVGDDTNTDSEMYKARLKQHLLKGLPGFIIGFVLFSALFIWFAIKENPGLAFSDIIAFPIFAIVLGIACAGIPYGWGLINKLLGQWSFWGHILVVIFLFFLKFAFALWIGMIAYPIALVYYFIRSQKTKRKVKIWTIVVISAVVLWYTTIGIAWFIDAQTEKNNEDSTPPTETIKIVDTTSLAEEATLINNLSQAALLHTQENEKEDHSSGWSITSPSQVHGVFYIQAENPENTYRNILKGIDVSNALVIVSGYYIEDAGPITVNQWEMDICVYPNFFFDENEALMYDTDNMYSHSLRSDDMDDFLEWFRSEYSNMTIVELEIP